MLGLSLWAKIVLLSQSSDLLRVKLVNILRTCIIKNTRELSIIHFVHERSWNRKLIASTALIWLVYGSKWLLCPPSFRLRATYRYKLVEIHDSSVCQEWGLEWLDLQWMFGIQLCDSIFRRGEFPALPSSSLTKPPVWYGILFCTFGRHIFFSTHAGIYVGSWFFGILMR